jgi:hypothetical protein
MSQISPAPQMCNPEGGGSECEAPQTNPAEPVEFHPARNVPAAAVESAKKAPAGRLRFHDINVNSNLRAQIAQAFHFYPFERVVDFPVSHICALPKDDRPIRG